MGLDPDAIVCQVEGIVVTWVGQLWGTAWVGNAVLDLLEMHMWHAFGV